MITYTCWAGGFSTFRPPSHARQETLAGDSSTLPPPTHARLETLARYDHLDMPGWTLQHVMTTYTCQAGDFSTRAT
ncbi:hypothetical protein RRG08_053960 [Elysia crispata]|uniref:Uncharacterized protein n=1 Tax=Elysia crispata TaxID=231223 RepID=A0AAE0ZGA1_9GAST|nr:hypothetical protein RRG08_053960 [Elysia crispata]